MKTASAFCAIDKYRDRQCNVEDRKLILSDRLAEVNHGNGLCQQRLGTSRGKPFASGHELWRRRILQHTRCESIYSGKFKFQFHSHSETWNKTFFYWIFCFTRQRGFPRVTTPKVHENKFPFLCGFHFTLFLCRCFHPNITGMVERRSRDENFKFTME